MDFELLLMEVKYKMAIKMLEGYQDPDGWEIKFQEMVDYVKDEIKWLKLYEQLKD